MFTDGQAALARGEWAAARRDFEAALDAEDTAEAWEGLSWATWWLSDADATIAARERAHRAYRAAGDAGGAARTAAWLASDFLDFRGEDAVAVGWMQRARRLLDGHPMSPDHGWIEVIEGDAALHLDADPRAAIAHARKAAQIGREFVVPDLEALGLGLEGIALVGIGEVGDGMRRLDEASALASGKEPFLLTISQGWALCFLVSACEGVGDFPRATQWCSAMRSFAERWNTRHMLGMCRSAYGSVLATQGHWPAAEAELTAAVGDLEITRPGLAATGHVRLGELRARQGRTAEARELYERARPHPLALVGLGVLALDDGEAQAAADAAERVLRRAPDAALLERVPALELLARAHVALCDFGAAGEASAELARACDALGTAYLIGRAQLVAAEVARAQRRLDDARRACEDALDRFAESAAPYDAALARLELACALDALGRDRAAASERASAREILSRLGVTEQRSSELSPREIEVLRLVAEGLSDQRIAERLFLSPHTVHRHVANARTKLRQPSRAAAVGYAARAGLL